MLNGLLPHHTAHGRRAPAAVGQGTESARDTGSATARDRRCRLLRAACSDLPCGCVWSGAVGAIKGRIGYTDPAMPPPSGRRAQCPTAISLSAPNGIRTRVAALKGRSPRPLDDGDCAGEITEPLLLVRDGKKARSTSDVSRGAPGPVAAVVWLMGRITRPRAAEVRRGTRPLATATSTLITNWDHLLSVVARH